MSRSRLSDADFDRMASMRAAGKSLAQIGRALRCHESTVGWHCLRLGIDTPRPRQHRMFADATGKVYARAGHVVRRFTIAEDQRLLALEREGLSCGEIGRRIGRNHNVVVARLRILALYDARAERDVAVRQVPA